MYARNENFDSIIIIPVLYILPNFTINVMYVYYSYAFLKMRTVQCYVGETLFSVGVNFKG